MSGWKTWSTERRFTLKPVEQGSPGKVQIDFPGGEEELLMSVSLSHSVIPEKREQNKAKVGAPTETFTAP